MHQIAASLSWVAAAIAGSTAVALGDFRGRYDGGTFILGTVAGLFFAFGLILLIVPQSEKKR